MGDLWPLMKAKTAKAALADYRKRWLGFLERFIEPLAADAEEGGNPQFAGFCQQMSTLDSLDDLADRLQVEKAKDVGMTALLRWALELQSVPVPSLYALACFWALPGPGKVSDSLEHQLKVIQALDLTADALRLLERPDLAVELLESWLTLPRDAFDEPGAMSDALSRSSTLRDLHPSVSATLLTTLADSLHGVADRGPRQAVILLEAWAGLSGRMYADRDKLADALGGTHLAALKHDPLASANLIMVLAASLHSIPDRGARHAGALLEAWLNLLPSSYGDSSSLATALGRSPLAGIDDPSTWANVLMILCSAMIGIEDRDPRHATALLEAWLKLPPRAYSSHSTLAAALEASPLAEVTDHGTKANVLSRLAMGLASPSHAVMLLEAWLGLTEEDYLLGGDGLTAKLARSGLGGIGDSLTWANYLTPLALSLQHVGRRTSHAAALLEAWIQEPLPAFASGKVMPRLPAETRLGVIMAWSQAVGPSHHDIPLTCEASVMFIRSVRDGDLPTYLHRRDFLGKIVGFRNELESIVLQRATQTRNSGREDEAVRLEQRVLAWSEELENRLLVERLLDLYGRFSNGEKTIPPGWQSGHWPLRHVQEPSQPYFRDPGPPAARFRWSKGTPAKLGSHRPSRLSELPEPATSARIPPAILDRRREFVQQARHAPVLEQLIPTGSVWVRAIFGREGQLYWWAWRRSGSGLELLTHGTSEPGAWNRLEATTHAFDLDIERTWAEYQWPGPRNDLATRSMLLILAQLLEDDTRATQELGPPDAARDELVCRLREAIHRLAETRFRLAELGWVLLEWHLAPTEQRPPLLEGLASLFRQGVEALDREWPEPFGTPERDARLRRDLDDASRNHLAAVQREFDLEPLWAATQHRVNWPATDILWQVRGPLLAAPLAWLSFGGSPLFRQVASTSSVASLTLRHLAEREAAEAGKPPMRLLSAQWLEPADWMQLRGLAYLHAGLRQVGAMNGWEVWGLGDDPAASAANLRMALGQRQRPFGAAVVGGHGHDAGAGVALEDGLWSGNGTDLGSLDWLLLVACAVGRLKQTSERDVEGLYTELVAHGARCVVAARWPIADGEAATFATEIVHQYLHELNCKGALEPFARARALNRARCRLLDSQDAESEVSMHLTAAFEMYGLG